MSEPRAKGSIIPPLDRGGGGSREKADPQRLAGTDENKNKVDLTRRGTPRSNVRFKHPSSYYIMHASREMHTTQYPHSFHIGC